MRHWQLAALLLALFFGLAVSSAQQKSATWDETHYLGVGAHLLETGRWNIPSASLHPPLGFYLSGFLLLFADRPEECIPLGPSQDVIAGVQRGNCLLRTSQPGGDSLLLLARLPGMLVGVLLGWLLYTETRRLLGDTPALVALGLYATNPTVLAHARLATPDLLFAACAFGALSATAWAVRGDSKIRFALAGVALGGALLTKYAALLFLPVVVALPMAAAFFDPKSSRPTRHFDSKQLIGLGILLGAALLSVIIAYRFHPLLWLEGIRAQQTIVGNGFPAYLGGEVSTDGFALYYLYAFLVKEPLASLALIGTGLAVWSTRRRMGWFDTLHYLLPPVAVFAAFSWFRDVNLGIRYVLPAHAFLFVVAAGGMAILLDGSRRNLWRSLLVVLLAWQAVACLAIYPHYLAYFNETVGGPEQGHHHLVDSNLDWGQDLKLLARWTQENGVEEIKLSYFGSADPRQYGIQYQALPSFVLPFDSPPAKTIDHGDVVVVSATNLHEVFVALGPLGEMLRSAQPVARIGYSMFVYVVGE